MLKRIIDISINNKFIILLITFFAVGWGVYTVYKTPIDAIPDLSDVQVIIYTEYPGQAPQVVEDQITYPLTTAMLAVPKAKVVRGYSFFGVSFVYVIFEDGTDMYWARSRVLEYLNFASGKLPGGVTPSLGPDATGVGWVFEYTIEGKNQNLAELRSIQDWYVRYQLTKVPGVSEVASIGGFVKQYQVNIDPNRLITYDVSLRDVVKAIEMGAVFSPLSEYMDKAGMYLNMLEAVMTDDGMVPELYTAGKPNWNVPLAWAQSFYIVARQNLSRACEKLNQRQMP